MKKFTNLDAMAEQRLAEIYEMGYKSVEEWSDAWEKRLSILTLLLRGNKPKVGSK